MLTQSVSVQLSNYLQAIAALFENSALTLNISKTMSVGFSSRAHLVEKLHLKINGQDIKQVTDIKYLGLILE